MRAVPTNSGDAIVWSGRVIHFGGRAAVEAKYPRISIAFASSVKEFEDPGIRLGKEFPQYIDTGVESETEDQEANPRESETLGKRKRETMDSEQDNGAERERKRTKQAAPRKKLVLPTLKERLGVIAAQMYTYEYKEPLSDAIAKVLELINKQFEGDESEPDDKCDDSDGL